MKYVKSVEAALRATAPFVAIPVEGHAPACVRGKLLKGALKGVKITSVKLVTEGQARWLSVQGRAEGGVRTCSKIVTTSIRDYQVFRAMREWTEKEREKRVKAINQGVLSTAERKALKLKEAQAKEEQRRNAELIEAKQEEAEILASAKARVFPEITPVDPESRERIVAAYSAFRVCCVNRKRGSVIRWKLAKLREQAKAMTTEKREYEEGKRTSGWYRPRRACVGKKTVLRRQKDKLQYMALIFQIGQLETQFKALYPSVWHECKYADIGGTWEDTFIAKRPTANTYIVPWHWGREDAESIKRLADRLREARANIRTLTPPADEDEEELSIAA